MQAFFDFQTLEPVKRELHLVVPRDGARHLRLAALGYRAVLHQWVEEYPDVNHVSGAEYDDLYKLLHTPEA